MEIVLLLVLAGILLILAEFVLPGLIAGSIGLGCLVVAVILGYVRFDVMTGHLLFAGVLLVLILSAWCWLVWFPKSRLGNVFVSHQVIQDQGFQAPQMSGKAGITLSDLHPSGMASIEGRTWDVVSEGDFIEAQSPIQVVLVEGNRIVVRRILVSDTALTHLTPS